MKVIDLLNKIANGEEVPQKIKVGNKVYNYETFNIGKGDNYFTAEWEEVKGYRINYDGAYYYLEIRDYNLNDEVEIIEEKKTPTLNDIRESYGLPRIEEKKIPEKLDDYYLDKKGKYPIELTMYEQIMYEQILRNKINEILDYLESEVN